MRYAETMPNPTPRSRREPVELPLEHVEAANEAFRLHLKGWQLCEGTLALLRQRCPGHAPEDVLGKATVVNALYGTNVFAIIPAARHLSEVLSKADLDRCGIELVDEMAAVKLLKRRFVSFASKYAHFFIDGDRFPIYDSFAVKMVSLHLGLEGVVGDGAGYRGFCAGFNRLADRLGLTRDRRRLDRYLWMAGIGRELRRNEKGAGKQRGEGFFRHVRGSHVPTGRVGAQAGIAIVPEKRRHRGVESQA